MVVQQLIYWQLVFPHQNFRANAELHEIPKKNKSKDDEKEETTYNAQFLKVWIYRNIEPTASTPLKVEV